MFVAGVLAEAAPLVPLVGIGGLLGVGLVLIAAAFLMFGLIYLFDYTIGLLMDAMAGLVKGVPFVGGIAKSGIESAKHNIRSRMVGAADSMERTGGRFFHGAGQLADYVGQTLVDFASSTHAAIASLVESVIPANVTGATRPIAIRLGAVRTYVDHLFRENLRRLTQGIDRLNTRITNVEHRLQGGIDNVETKAENAVTDAAGIATGQIAAQRKLAHDILNGKIASWEQITSYAAIGAIALATLTRVFPYWQCTNVRAFNRLLCRSPIGLLEDLFGLALLALGPISIVEFGRLLQEVVEEVDDGVRYFVT